MVQCISAYVYLFKLLLSLGNYHKHYISRAFIVRLLADPAFMYRLLLEEVATMGCSVWWEFKNRKDRLVAPEINLSIDGTTSRNNERSFWNWRGNYHYSVFLIFLLWIIIDFVSIMVFVMNYTLVVLNKKMYLL